MSRLVAKNGQVEFTAEAGEFASESRSLPEPSLSSGRDEALDALKALAIIGVLFAHMSFTSRMSARTLSWIVVFQQSFGWCVTGFFFCAGVLTRVGGEGLAGCFSFALKRTRRLLVPCLVFSLTYKCCLLIIHIVFHSSSPEPRIPCDASGWIQFLFSPVGPQFYFLHYLFVLSVLAVFAIRLFKNLTALSWVVLAGCFVFYFIQQAPSASYGSAWNLLPGYLLSYWGGLLAGRGFLERPVWWITASVLVACGCVFKKTFVFAHLFIPALLYWLLQHLSLGDCMKFIGQKSGAIYVWHDPLLLPACSILATKLLPWGPLQVTLVLALGISVSVLVAEAVNRCRFLSWYRF